MGFANIRRPQIVPRLNLENVLFWNKRTSDNIDAINAKLEYVEIDGVQGAQTLFDNPRREALPIGFIPTNTVIVDTDDTETPALPLAGFELDLSRTDGQLGLTTHFQPPQGQIDLIKSTPQVGVLNNAQTDVTFDIENTKFGEITHAANSANIVCAVAGFVQVSWSINYSSAGTPAFGNYVNGFVYNLVSGMRWATMRVQAGCFSENVCGADVVPVAAGDTLVLAARHVNSTATARDLGSGTAQGTYLRAYYVAPPTDYAATVRGYLVYA